MNPICACACNQNNPVDEGNVDDDEKVVYPVQVLRVLNDGIDSPRSPCESHLLAKETKDEKKKKLKEIVAAFAQEVQTGISCLQCVVVDGVFMMNKRVLLSMNESMTTVSLGTKSSLVLIVPLSTAKFVDYNKLLSLRPDNVALKAVKDDDRASTVAIYNGPELIIIIANDPKSGEKILKGLQVLGVRARHVEEDSTVEGA